jgi:Na+/H+ antiporter NhaA
MSFDALNDVNWLAIVVAAAAWWILGALWYAPPVFGKRWIRAAGIPIEATQRPRAAAIVVPLIAEFVASIALAMLARATGSTTFGEGIVLGLVVGVGLLLTTYLVEATFGNRPQAGTWFAITGAYQLLGVLIASVIVTVWT